MIGIHKNHPSAYFDGVRGLAVMFVWLSHSSGRDQELVSWLSFHGLGHIGVMLFFVLSGYLLAIPFENGRDFSYSRYLLRRFLRIIPLYYIVVTGVYIFQLYYGTTNTDYLYIEQGFWGYLKHLVLYRGDGIFWTIPTEFVFYLILPLVALFLLSQRVLRFVLVGVLALLYGIYHLAINIKIVSAPGLALIETGHHSQYLDVFLIGVMFGLLSKNEYIINNYRNHFKLLDRAIFFVFVAVIILTIIAVCKSIFVFNQPFYNVRYASFLYAFLFALTLFSLQIGNKYLKLIFESRLLIYMGVIGYSWYLLHMPAIQMVNTLELSSWIKFILSSTLLFAVCTITYILIEEPFIKIGKYLSIKKVQGNCLVSCDKQPGKY
ncbi:MAG: acyltransferase [Gammaproteobacteria bacterium]